MQTMRRGVLCSRKRLVSSSRPSAATAAAAATTETAAAPTSSPSGSTPPRANVVALLRSRGLLNDVAGEGAEDALSKTSTGVYCGFDPTAPSLHVGNLLGIVALSWFAAAGHVPIALLGGATGRVGDPSGRSTERPLLSDEEIEANVAGIRKILEELLGRAASGEFTAAALAEEAGASSSSPASSSSSSPPPAPRILNNLDWFGPITFLEFLRDVGKHARVGAMLSRDSVRSRMSSSGAGDPNDESGKNSEGISFTEFAYQLLQGYDFVHLSRNEGVTVQIGGSDQMGNVVAGLDLIRRMKGDGGGEGEEGGGGSGGGSSAPSSPSSRCYGITFPLLTKSDGTKMGKSAGGAVWLAAEKLSPFKFYQYLLSSTPDADVVKFLKMLTFLPLSKIDEVERAMRGEGGPGRAPYLPNDAAAAAGGRGDEVRPRRQGAGAGSQGDGCAARGRGRRERRRRRRRSVSSLSRCCSGRQHAGGRRRGRPHGRAPALGRAGGKRRRPPRRRRAAALEGRSQEARRGGRREAEQREGGERGEGVGGRGLGRGQAGAVGVGEEEQAVAEGGVNVRGRARERGVFLFFGLSEA